MTDNRDERLIREMRRWAERPTTLSPQAARERVLASLPDRRRRPAWGLAAVGAALAAAALVVALVVDRPAPPPAPQPPAASGAERTIVHQLSSGTKMYIILRPDTLTDGS